MHEITGPKREAVDAIKNMLEVSEESARNAVDALILLGWMPQPIMAETVKTPPKTTSFGDMSRADYLAAREAISRDIAPHVTRIAELFHKTQYQGGDADIMPVESDVVGVTTWALLVEYESTNLMQDHFTGIFRLFPQTQTLSSVVGLTHLSLDT